MCGIAGIVFPVAHASEPRAVLERMNRALLHRGPDAHGCHFFGRCALGHTRLSIVDLSSGQQPMLSHDQKLGITFNGEIYGYKKIRAELGDYPYRTHSDTEVILALYEKHGGDFLPRLPGMFSFALWDESSQELICARDRFGEKPFYYARGLHDEFIFASEIKAILASGMIQPVVSRAAVQHYLQHLYVHPHDCIYENIHVLPPAHTLRFRAGHLEVMRYWQLPQLNSSITMDDAVEHVQYLLRQAVERQLVADVPVAAFLSGGLDSTTIVALARKFSPGLRTISFGFDDGINELPYAREVKSLYQTDHVELVDNHADIAELLLKMNEVYDEPFADSSNIPTYLISQQAREHAKVVLTGDGGDELFAGYSQWYRPLYFMQQETDTSVLRLLLLKMVGATLARARCSSADPWLKKRDGLLNRRAYTSVSRMHQAQNEYLSDATLSEWGWAVQEKPIVCRPSWSETNTVDDALRMDIEDYMPGDILVKIDRASMAHGLELRAPFLDMDLASFCISLPSTLKINATEDKRVMRQAFAHLWPESVRHRKKQGFGAPVNRWLARPGVCSLKEEYLNNRQSKLFDVVSFDKTRGAASRDNYTTWILLVLALWMDRNRTFQLN